MEVGSPSHSPARLRLHLAKKGHNTRRALQDWLGHRSITSTAAGAEPAQELPARLIISPRSRQQGCQDTAARSHLNATIWDCCFGQTVQWRGEVLWGMGPGITAKLMSVHVKRRIRLILGAAYPWKGRADFGVKSPNRRPSGTKCLNRLGSIKQAASCEKSVRADELSRA